MTFAGKRVLVTGATRGIGHATARAFIAAGARVAVNGTTPSTVRAVCDAIGAVPAPGDVASASGCESIVAAALDGLGGLDVLVNNAGVYVEGPFERVDEATWDRVVDINVKGTFFCARAALGALRSARGSIVNVASESGVWGYRLGSVYCAAKGAVVNLTRQLAIELAPDVRVNAVSPGPVATNMLQAQVDQAKDPAAHKAALDAWAPMKRVGRPEEVASAILFLASDACRFVTGANHRIDGGATAGR